MANEQAQQQQAPTFDPIAEFRKAWPKSNFTDQQILQGLQDPAKFRKAFPQYARLDDATIVHNMAAHNPQEQVSYAAPGSVAPQSFTKGSPEEAAFLAKNQGAVPVQTVAPVSTQTMPGTGPTNKGQPIPAMQPSTGGNPLTNPNVVRAATGTLPYVAGTAGAAAGTMLGANPATAAAGGALAGEAGKQAELAANRAIFGEGEPSQTSPYEPGNLVDTATRMAGNAAAAAPIAKGIGMDMEEAAAKKAAAETADIGQQITEQTTAKQGLKASAQKVMNLATEATDDGVTLDPHVDLRAYVNKLPKAAQQEFLDKVMPKISSIGDSIVTKTKTGWAATPTDVLKYRDAVYDMMQNDSKLAPYADDVYEQLTKTLQSKMKEEGYRGFGKADNLIQAGTNVENTASALGKAAPAPVASTPLTLDEDPAVEKAEPTMMSKVKAFAKAHPVATGIGTYLATRALGNAATRKISDVMGGIP